MKLKKGDEVKVVLGKDKGKTGKVESVDSKNHAATVTGVNQYKRHVKGRAGGQKSEIITITKPMPFSKVVLICPHCHVATRVGFAMINDKKERRCKKCEKAI